ncbi:MAG TPA: flagellar filament capping protein FliD [Rhodanobacteraceae bacterium]|nr:flagellar filament capping protein FliD [Rhodanobacteraceae bacterium]
MTTISSTDPLASLLNALGSGSSNASGTTGTGSSSSVGSPGTGLISSPGLGSGLDVNTLVAKLVQAEIQPAQNQIDNQRTNITTQTSALGNLKSLLASLQSSLSSLANGSAFTKYTATSSDTDVFAATAGASALPGTYQIEVLQTAAAQKLSSAAFASGAAVGTGTLTLAVGSQSINIDIDSSNNTLAGIRDAINGASDNPGVSATIVHATDGDHLMLTSSQTGVANAFSISASGGDGGLDALTWDASTGSGSLTQQTAAADAQVSIDGFTSTSSTNVVDGAIDGITLNLASADPGDPQTLTVGRDVTSMQDVVQGFVTAYNQFVQGAGQLASYDPTSQTAGPLLGDATLRGVRSALASVVSGAAGSNASDLRTLADIGVNLQADGTLQLDTGKLGQALGSDPSQVAALFGGTSGYGTQFNGLLNGYLQSGGLLDIRNQSLSTQSQQLDQQQAQLNQRQQSIQSRYLTQFTALDVTMSQMTQTSNFLTSQLGMLANISKPSGQ